MAAINVEQEHESDAIAILTIVNAGIILKWTWNVMTSG
jgi:hypothetical protein